MDLNNESFFDDDESPDCFSFYYTPPNDPEREHELHLHAEWDAPWTVPLAQFIEFLEAIYGYSLKEQIAVKYNPFRENWQGPTFGNVILTGSLKEPQQLDLFEDNYGGSD